VLFVRKSGIYTVTEAPEKVFAGPGLWYCGLADRDELAKVLFTVIYRDPATSYVYIKRCRIAGYIMNRDYFFAPDGMEVLHIDTRKNFIFTVRYMKKPRVKTVEKTFKAQSYEEKGLKALGVRLETREAESVEVEPQKPKGEV